MSVTTTDVPATRPTPERVDQDYPLARVPASARRGWFSVFVVVAGFLFFTPTMVTGGQVAGAFGFSGFAGLALVASSILALYVATLAAVSASTGLSTVLLSRLVLGRIGGKWASLVLGGTQVGWYGITVGVLANLLDAAFGWPVWITSIVGGIVMATTAYWGFKGIEVLSWVSVPLMLILCVWVTTLSLEEVGGWAGMLATEGDGSMTVGLALTAMIGTFISGGTQIGNWTRFSRRARTAFASVLGAVLVIELLMLGFGGIGAIAFGEADYTTLLLSLGLVALAVFLLVFNLWTTNDNAAYAFGVAGAELVGTPDKRPFIVGGVVIGIALAVTGVADSMTTFLVVLGTVIPPLGGTIIGTYLFVWRRRDPGTSVDDVPLVRWSGVAAYAAGTAVAAAGVVTGLGSPAIQGVVVALLAAPLLATIERRIVAGSAR